jgi:hypothetical protein
LRNAHPEGKSNSRSALDVGSTMGSLHSKTLRGELRKRLLRRLRGTPQAILDDAGLRHLADNASRRLTAMPIGYGEFTQAIDKISRVLEILASLKANDQRLVSAQDIRRMQTARSLPRLDPWL